MSDEWYYALAGEKQGPLSRVALREAIVSGELGRDVLVWAEPMSEWMPACAVGSLSLGAPPLPAVREAQPIPSDRRSIASRMLDSDGRFSRSEFAKVFFGLLMANLVFSAVLGMVYDPSGGGEGFVALYLLLVVVQVVILALSGVRRLHDLDASGWPMVAMFMPLANVVLLLYLLFAAGKEPGETRWG